MIYCLAFVGGIVLAGVFSVKVSFWWLGLLLPLLILAGRHSRIKFILLILLSFAGGYIRLACAQPVSAPDKIFYYNNSSEQEWSALTTWQWRGRVIVEPDKRSDHTKLVVEAKEIDIDNLWQSVSGRVLVKVSLYPEYQYGDILEIACKLLTPTTIEDFAYDDYLARYDIYSLCYSPRIEKIGQPEKFSLTALILKFKDSLQAIFQENLLEPEAGLLSALLLARRRSLPTALVEDFARVGVSHLVAISGMHMAIISLLIVRLLAIFSLPKKISYPLAGLLLGGYLTMLAWPASAVRAGLMGGVVLVADYYGRINKSQLAVLLTAVAMLLVNPKLLLFDVGWQLSFLAVLSLVLFNEPVGKLFSHWPALGGVTEILKTTLAVQILTCPWMVYKFSQLSLVAPLANVLLLPTLPLILVLGIIFLILSALWPPAAILVGWVVWYLLHQMISLVETLSAWPLAAIEINGLDFCWVIIIYFFIFLLKTKPRSFLRKTG